MTVVARYSCAVWLMVAFGALAQTNAPLAVTIQPPNGVAAVGEDFAFTASAAGTAPFAYQWQLNGANLTNETGGLLLLTNLASAQGGFYSVVVSNVTGSVTSSYAPLSVLSSNTVRRVQTGRLLQTGSKVGVPIQLRANGRESSVSFSLSFDTNHYANPVFLPADANASVTVSNSPAGFIGLAETLPAGKTFAPGYPWVGLVQFDLVKTNSALLGALAFAIDPIPLGAANSNGLALAISAAVQAEFVLVTTNVTLDLQSGLFLQQALVSNPGASDMLNVNLIALGLGTDSRTNAIKLYNASASLIAFPYNDRVMAVGDTCCGYSLDTTSACDLPGYLACGSGGSSIDYTGATNVSLPFGQIPVLAAGQTLLVTSEYYVSDHRTVPRPQYSISSSGGVLRTAPSGATPLAVTRYLYDTNRMRFILQFPTQLGMTYYVQYAGNPADVTTTNALTAIPTVIGTGSAVQWIDDGPPKTLSPPTNGSRFYRVLETP